MTSIFQSPFIEALGWSLVDSLWQMGTVWLFYVMITGNGNRLTASMRHTLALLATATGTLTFFFSLLLNYFNAVNNHSLFSLAYFVGKQVEGLLSDNSHVKTVVPFLSIIYIPAVTYSFFKLIYQVNTHKNLYRTHLLEPGDQLIAFAQRITTTFRIPKNVAIWMSEKIQSPLTVGFWKPIVVLPIAVLSQLSCKQVEAVLVHELYHVKRNDYLLNIFLSATEVIFFFNPFARLLSGIVKKERENSCDDIVIAMGYDSWDYSQALYILSRYRFQGQLAVGATGVGKEYLLERIKRMMNRTNASPSIRKPLIAFFLCLLVTAITSRQSKPVPVLADVSSTIEKKPAVYSYEENVINIQPPTSPEEKPILKAIKPMPTEAERPALNKEKTNQQTAAPSPAPPPAPAPNDEPVTTYVAAPEVIEFTMIDPPKPAQPARLALDKPHPYVPASSFYYTEIDTTTGKSVIKL